MVREGLLSPQCIQRFALSGIVVVLFHFFKLQDNQLNFFYKLRYVKVEGFLEKSRVIGIIFWTPAAFVPEKVAAEVEVMAGLVVIDTNALHGRPVRVPERDCELPTPRGIDARVHAREELVVESLAGNVRYPWIQ